MRAFKTVNDQYIEPISFTVPRRAETFQSDIYPPAVGSKPALSAEEWLAGKEALPPKIEFESIYEGGAPKEVPGDYKPAATPAPAPAPVPKPAPKEPEPAAAPPPAARSPPPSMKDQGQSMAAMASKFEDKEEVEDDASSFEEIAKPVQRKVEAKAPAPTTTASAPAPKPAAAPLKSPSSFAPSPAVSSPAQPASSSNAAGSGSETTLDQIRELLESQSQQLVNLTGEVENLKKRVGSGTQDQSERIRQLELELETLRS